MHFAVDPECAFRELLLRIKQERIVDQLLINMALHIRASLLLLLGVDEPGDDFKSGGVVFAPSWPPLSLRVHNTFGRIVKLTGHR